MASSLVSVSLEKKKKGSDLLKALTSVSFHRKVLPKIDILLA